jgi:predicted GH43/DUF377 family glycosyl hydrolase
MSISNKKTLESVKNETIIPIGFYEYKNTHSIFCRVKEHPKHIYLIPKKRDDFTKFSEYKELIVFKSRFLDEKIKLENIDNIVSSQVNKKKVITFIYKKGKNKHLYWAISKKENEWIVQGSILDIKEVGGAVSDHKHEKDYVIYYGESSINTVLSPDFIKWKKGDEPILKPRPGFFDKNGLRFVASKVIKKGILVFYESSYKEDDQLKLQIGAALFSLSNPRKIIWRSDSPFFEGKIGFEDGVECKGAIFSDLFVSFYWSSNKHILATSIVLPLDNLFTPPPQHFERHEANPLISPEKDWWRSEGTFNPAAINIDGDIHILFRALGQDGISRIGHAFSPDGVNIETVDSEPVFALKYSHFGDRKVVKRFDPVMYPSGGSWGGCEDPRMVLIDDKIYVTFNAFDAWDNIRVGLITISKEDFLDEKWEKWSEPKLISPKGRNKNWVIFPEKINGKFAVLHNLYDTDPNKVVIDYVEDIESVGPEGFDFKSQDPQKMPNNKIAWHNRMRSVGTPPIKTEKGWLVFYHATDRAEPSKYKMGAMLLDLNDPTKIISRFSFPVLTPDMWYENDWKPGIIYSCGAVVKEDKIYVYYGGGDKHVCVVVANLNEFLDAFNKGVEKVPFITRILIG